MPEAWRPAAYLVQLEPKVYAAMDVVLGGGAIVVVVIVQHEVERYGVSGAGELPVGVRPHFSDLCVMYQVLCISS